MHVLRTKPLLVYLADLTHVGNGIAAEAFPLNIGLIKSAAIKRFGTAVDIRLFKYPDKLMDAINARAPDVLGCSNYTWNFNLSCYFCRFVKSVSVDPYGFRRNELPVYHAAARRLPAKSSCP